MGFPYFNQFKKNATSFMQERYKDARILLTATTEAEMLVEEVTNNEPCSPDERTMSRIAEASYDINNYWRIVDVLHKRLYRVDWKYWRRSYKSLVLIEFLISHGPEEFSAEFDDQIDVIQELGSFIYTDENRIDWGENMRKCSERILELLKGGEALIEARLNAINNSNTEIHQRLGRTSISSALPLSSSSSFNSLESTSYLPDTPSSSGSSVSNQDYSASSSSSEGEGRHLEGSESDDALSEYDDHPLSPPTSRRNVVEKTADNFSSPIEIEDEERNGNGKVFCSCVGDLCCSKLGINGGRGNGRKIGCSISQTPNDAAAAGWLKLSNFN